MEREELMIADMDRIAQRPPRGLRTELDEFCRGAMHRDLARYMLEAAANPTEDSLTKGALAATTLLTLVQNGLGDQFMLPSELVKQQREIRAKLRRGETVSDSELEGLSSTISKPEKGDDLKFLLDRVSRIIDCLGDCAALPTVAFRINSIMEKLSGKEDSVDEVIPAQQEIEYSMTVVNNKSIAVINKALPELDVGIDYLFSLAKERALDGVIIGGLRLAQVAELENVFPVEVQGVKMHMILMDQNKAIVPASSREGIDDIINSIGHGL